jgi:hypothetical protein
VRAALTLRALSGCAASCDGPPAAPWQAALRCLNGSKRPATHVQAERADSQGNAWAALPLSLPGAAVAPVLPVLGVATGAPVFAAGFRGGMAVGGTPLAVPGVAGLAAPLGRESPKRSGTSVSQLFDALVMAATGAGRRVIAAPGQRTDQPKS